MSVGNRNPHIDRALGGLDDDAHGLQTIAQEIPAVAEAVDALEVIVLRSFDGSDPGALDRVEYPRVNVRLESLHSFDRNWGPGDPTDPPAGHVVRLGERMEFDRAVHRAVDLEDAGGYVAVEGDLGVGGIVCQ